MSALPRIIIPPALLIILALCPRPASGGSASAGATNSAPAPGVPTAPSSSRSVALSRLYNSLAANTRAAPAVLVIPGREMASEIYDRIVEDLSVMSRIIEKSLHAPSEGLYDSLVTTGLYTKGGRYGQSLLLPSDGAVPPILRSSGGRPKSMYVGGYGAVFSLRVNFPLVPPPETPKAANAAEPTDPVWAAAQRELAEPESIARSRRAGPAGPPYKAEAVEELRNTLTADLKHAANIRDLEPDSWLLILVQGSTAVPEQPQSLSDDQASYPTAPAAAGTLLTLRAKKADIDQFAKGQLDETQFCQRVQTVAR
jgi:hypothetical protein